MKVIDLLNKIANGEEVPKKIIQHCKVFEEDKYWILSKGSHKCYEKKYINNDEDSEFLFDYLTCDMLTDEVEIIEEDKKIEKLKLNYSHIKHVELPFFKEEILNYCDNLQYKINEIIDILNKGDDK